MTRCDVGTYMLTYSLSLCLLQNAFQVGIDHERDALFPAVIAETQPLVFAQQSNGVIV